MLYRCHTYDTRELGDDSGARGVRSTLSSRAVPQRRGRHRARSVRTILCDTFSSLGFL